MLRGNFPLTKSFYSTYEELKRHYVIEYVPFRDSFYSTYEELKQIYLWLSSYPSGLFLQYLWGIETTVEETSNNTANNSFYSTYEELKPSYLPRLLLRLLSFYSTYEELKHNEQAIIQMVMKMFLQYLWGIETM